MPESRRRIQLPGDVRRRRGKRVRAIREELISKQEKRSGAWSGEISEDYATACALIILQMPNRYLPVFNGKGPGS